MNITSRSDKDIVYIALEGRIDASNASNADKQIFEIKHANEGKHVVLDADDLEYISSAGLRVILKLRKEEADLAIINVSPEVYEVLDMTGFTDMVKVEKAYPRISVDGCEFIAKGANGAVYRYDEETIVKVYFAKDSLPAIHQERENARKAFVLGVNTAIPYGVVRIGDGYGLVTELLNATSVSKLIRKDPSNTEIPAKYYIDMLKTIHSTEVCDGEVPDMKAIALSWVSDLEPHLPESMAKKLRALIEGIPACKRLLHGDYNTNNIMVQNGEALLIDMDTLSMGHPVFELGSMFNAFLGFSELDHNVVISFMGYDHETAKAFWERSLKLYLDTEDESTWRAVEDKAKLVGYMRLLRRSIRRPNEQDSAKKVAHYRTMLAELLDRVDCLDF